MSVLVTGASGFSGKHLVESLRKENICIFSTSLSVSEGENSSPCDLLDYKSVLTLLYNVQPCQIYHLAGSFTNRFDIDFQTNVLTTKNIINAILELKIKCRLLLVGSAAEYGKILNHENPVSEKHILNPISWYGLTKLYQTNLMSFYDQVNDVDIVMARSFNLYGEGISPDLFVGTVLEQIQQVKKGVKSGIKVGYLGNKRDYLHIEEAVKYYRKIMDNGDSGMIFNVGRGSSIYIHELLKTILEKYELNMDVVETSSTEAIDQEVSDIYANVDRLLSL
jgi:GDP-4-dehydro-6-deoxy-D-mannose reductase